MLKSWLVMAVALAGCAVAGAQGKPEAGSTKVPDETAVQKEIMETLRSMYEAEKRQDINFVFEHLSDDFAEVAGDGKVYHKSDIAPVAKEMHLNEYSLSECHFKLMKPDAAYLTCDMKVDAEFKGQPLPSHFRVTWVWTHEKTGWLVRFEQATVIPEAPKADLSK